ncbi:MAG: hypothetical protein OEU50_14925 [Gammaproteobacteria bacterium]|nr:hypothetical protein [Gammaproteobacteria bacterium]
MTANPAIPIAENEPTLAKNMRKNLPNADFEMQLLPSTPVFLPGSGLSANFPKINNVLTGQNWHNSSYTVHCRTGKKWAYASVGAGYGPGYAFSK